MDSGIDAKVIGLLREHCDSCGKVCYNDKGQMDGTPCEAGEALRLLEAAPPNETLRKENAELKHIVEQDNLLRAAHRRRCHK